MDLKNFKWIREPKEYAIKDGAIEIVTRPRTDLWQRTYYHFQTIMLQCYKWNQKKNILVLL